MARERTTEKRFGGADISLRAQQKIHCLSRLIDGAVEIDLVALDFDVGLIDAPRSADLARETIPSLFKFRNVALNPAHDGRMGNRQAALRHHFHEVSEAELVSQIPAHTENDDFAVEMASFEKIVPRSACP
ncbi:hypothetical protein [Methylosinus sp. H3A]|uniref:hypothetical protein n=1 Tax=Methylosinus sp. H3A TaxID=2785786 RepID=UPI0039170FE3